MNTLLVATLIRRVKAFVHSSMYQERNFERFGETRKPQRINITSEE